MRKTFDLWTSEKALKENIYLLHCDLWRFPSFENCCPERVINLGLAENMVVNMANGLASTGARVFIYDVANFIMSRNMEALRLIENPIAFLSAGAGFTYSEVGDGHYLINDLALAQSVGMNIYTPEDGDDLISILESKYFFNGRSSYIRLGLDGFKKTYKDTRPLTKNIFISYGWMPEYLRNNFKNTLISIIDWQRDLQKYSDFFQNREYNFFVVEDHMSIGGLSSICKFPHTSICIQRTKNLGISKNRQDIIDKAGLSIERIKEIICE